MENLADISEYQVPPNEANRSIN